MRAVLLASATVTSMLGFRASIRSSHEPLGALLDEQVAGAEHEAGRLLLLALRRHEPHARSLRHFGNRLGIRSIVLMPLHEGFHMGRRNRAHLMTEMDQLARPMMGTATRSERDHATPLRSEEFQQLPAADPLTENDAPAFIGSVN